MARYTSVKFGELETVWKKVPNGGILLRENNEVVLLEQHFDDSEGKREEVLYQFEEGITLANRGDFCDCLAKAREYEPDFSVPIHIQTSAERAKEKDATASGRRAHYMAIVERSQTHPWGFFRK